MAIVINNAPDGGALYAAYVSQAFEVQDTVPTGTTPAALQVEVKNNGVLVDTLFYPAIEVQAGSPNDTCIFKIDLREVVQRLFTPNNLLPTIPGTTFNSTFTSETLFIECTFKTWKPDADGLLVLDLENTEDSIGYRVINATRHMFEAPYLAPYVAATDRKFLTSKPLNSWTDWKSSEYLYAWNPDLTQWYWWFIFYNAAGSVKSKCRIDNTDNINKLVGLGVGAANLIGLTYNNVLFYDGDPDGHGLVPAVASYVVFGSQGTGVFSTPITEIRTYYVQRDMCVKYRIHFLNKFGCWDYFPVRSEPNDTLSTKGDPYESTHPDNFIEGVVRHHVRNRGQVRANDGFEVEVAGIGPLATKWLEELMMTPLAYIERETEDIPDALRFYPIIVQDGRLDKSDRKFKFEVIYSREKISQRT